MGMIIREISSRVKEAQRCAEIMVAEILAEQGMDMSLPDTEEGVAQFRKQMNDLGLSVQKIIYADRPDESGYYVVKNETCVGFVPVQAVDGIFL